MMTPDAIQRRLSEAITHFWRTRLTQAEQQRLRGGGDQGTRGAVTGGAHCDGFISLFRDMLISCGIPPGAIHTGRGEVIPGFFRPTKDWDLVVVLDNSLVAALEVKSQVGSFGNNYNNRTEEALGNATDLLTAYREGAFRESAKPWLGYFMLLEDAPESTTPVNYREPYFRVFPEFHRASYARRYQLLCQRLVREQLYDAACLVLSSRREGLDGQYRELSGEVGIAAFAASLMGKATAFAQMRRA